MQIIRNKMSYSDKIFISLSCKTKIEVFLVPGVQNPNQKGPFTKKDFLAQLRAFSSAELMSSIVVCYYVHKYVCL